MGEEVLALCLRAIFAARARPGLCVAVCSIDRASRALHAGRHRLLVGEQLAMAK